jgi:hypothetical protein
VRALLATAGLLVLAGSAAAGLPSAHTLRKNTGGPIVATAQDGSSVAWLASSPKCDEVHLLAPGTPDRSLPQPSAGSTTCRWNLKDGQPQLAFAGRMAAALWTLHESGPTPFDYVEAANVGGPERNVDRLAHAGNGTGEWLGGVAGAGRTLAYSWADVEYVNKLDCLSGGSCKQKIADGGIELVTRSGKQPLPGAQPALGLAVSTGRIAYIPATIAKSGRPSANTNSSLYVVDAGSGSPVTKAFVRGIPVAIALSPHLLAVLTTQGGPHDRISWFSATSGTKLGSALVSPRAAGQLAATDQLIVYRVNRALYGVSTRGGPTRGGATRGAPKRGRPRLLAKTALDTTGFSLGKGMLVWAENRGGNGRLRAVTLP